DSWLIAALQPAGFPRGALGADRRQGAVTRRELGVHRRALGRRLTFVVEKISAALDVLLGGPLERVSFLIQPGGNDVLFHLGKDPAPLNLPDPFPLPDRPLTGTPRRGRQRAGLFSQKCY